jgi:hypothetical protein
MRPLSGSRPIKPKDHGEAFQYFALWLSELVDKHKPDALGRASCFVPRGLNVTHLPLLYGFVAEFERVGFMAGLKRYECDERTARKAVIGRCPKGREAIKAAALAACRMRDWPAADDHAADALVIGSFLLSELEPKSAYAHHPLFSRIKAVA